MSLAAQDSLTALEFCRWPVIAAIQGEVFPYIKFLFFYLKDDPWMVSIERPGLCGFMSFGTFTRSKMKTKLNSKFD